MSKPKPAYQEFDSQWNQATAWAQQNDIPVQTLQPVYQYDLGRLQAGEDAMSQAERIRAIKAANNPNDVTPVPTDHPSPESVVGNSVNDLRNIFTGLAPNHLIPNVFHMAESAVLHPSTWLKPLEDVGKGALTGNLSDIRKGFALASQPGDILGLLPGVSDVSQLLDGTQGVENLLENPVSAFLDAAPFAPAGKILSLASDEARMATVADKLGMPVEQLYKASVPRMGTAWLLSRDIAQKVDGTWTARYPGIGKLTQVLVDPQGKPLTLGGAFKMWGQTHTGVSRTAAHVASAAFDLRTYGTEAELFTVAPLQRAEEALTDDQRNLLHALVDKKTPLSQGKTVAEVMADDSIDPAVRDAYEKFTDVLDMDQSRTLASGGLVAVEGPGWVDKDGKFHRGDADLYSVTDEAHPVVQAARQARADLMDAVKIAGPMHKISLEVDKLDKAADKLVSALDDTRQKANQELVQGTISAPLRTSAKGAVKETVRLDLSRQAALLTGEDGLVAKIADAGSTVTKDGRSKQADYESMVALTAAAKKALSHDGYASVDAKRSETLVALERTVSLLHEYAKRRVSRERQFLKEMSRRDAPGLAQALKKAMKSQRDFEKTWWANPPDRWRSVLYEKMVAQILHRTSGTERIANLDDRLKDYGWDEKQIAAVHSDPTQLAHAIWQETKMAAENIGGARLLNDAEIREVYDNAVDEVNALREQGHEVTYVPVLSTLDIPEKDAGRYGVGIHRGALIKDLSMARRRTMDNFMPERHDLLAAVHLATKEAIQRDITIEFVDTHLAPHAMTAGDVATWAKRAFPDEFSTELDTRIRNEQDVLSEVTARRMGLVKWDPMAKVGFSFPRWQGKAVYLPKGLADSVDKLLERGQFPMDGAFDKATGVFRFAVLGLSPRYTAHIVFGGTFLLALRSSIRLPFFLGDALRMVKDGTMPQEIKQRATEFGLEPVEYRSLRQGLTAHAQASGHQGANMAIQADLAKNGIKWRDSTAAQWAKSAANVNYRFTNWVVKVQRSMAYLDGYNKALRDNKPFIDPETGVDMTAERAKFEGIQHALKAMGDLKAMTPFERTWMTRVIPFYGWTRHILQYVSTYPVDHPFRAQFLSVLADQQSDSVAKALDKRISFLFFLGSPDAEGNVSAVDVRFMDPLRDVANYATLGGWISALNPVISAPLAWFQPDIIYGSTSTYPNVSYDSFYGIEVAGTQGSPLNAVEQVVPQVTALDAALDLSGQYRQLASKNPTQFAKTIYESLNIPFAQVQHLNMKALAAKGEIARYDVAKSAASNAWQTGDFSMLAGYASVPNPLNTDYEITPAQLQALYEQAQQAYPGLPPSETVTPPPTPAGI